MAQDRFAAEGYKILQSVEIGGMEIVIAENREAEKPYLTWRRSVNEAFGAETHLLPVYSGGLCRHPSCIRSKPVRRRG